MSESQPLLDRDPTPEDLEAERDQPRPGVWAGERGADLRALTQDETDALIRFDLADRALRGGAVEYREVLGAIGASEDRPARPVDFGRLPRRLASMQRGGIDSDPLVRVLARRAWGERDRRWFELRGVRKGEAVRTVPIPGPPRSGSSVVLACPGERSFGVAQYDAAPGERVHVSDSTGVGSFVVSDRLREPPGASGEYDSIQRPIRTNHVSIGAVDPAAPERVMRPTDYRVIGGNEVDLLSMLEDSHRAVAEMVGRFASRWPDYQVLSVDPHTFRLAVAKAADDSPPAFRPGARRPGHKPAPPTPRWARKRRDRQPPPPRR